MSLTSAAYDNVLLALDDADLQRMRTDREYLPTAPRTVIVAHTLAERCPDKQVAACLADVLDGGDALDPALTHPRRVSVCRRHTEIGTLRAALSKAWSAYRRSPGYVSDDWLDPQVDAVLFILADAEERQLALVSLLNPESTLPRPRGTLAKAQ